jgi:hypothetical protein
MHSLGRIYCREFVIRHKDHQVLYFQLIIVRKIYLDKYFFGLYCYLLVEFLRRNITADWNKRRLLCFDDPILYYSFANDDSRKR